MGKVVAGFVLVCVLHFLCYPAVSKEAVAGCAANSKTFQQKYRAERAFRKYVQRQRNDLEREKVELERDLRQARGATVVLRNELGELNVTSEFEFIFIGLIFLVGH